MKWIYLLAAGLYITTVMFGVFSSKAFAESVPESSSSWQTTPITTLASSEDMHYTGPTPVCSGVRMQVIVGKARVKHEACVYGSLGSSQLARYLINGLSTFAFKKPFDSAFYELTNICKSLAACYYASETDTLISIRHNQADKVQLYLKFSEQLEQKVTTGLQASEYQFTQTGPLLSLPYGDPTNRISSVSFSENGKWAVYSAPLFGIVKIDIANKRASLLPLENSPLFNARLPLYVAISNGGQDIAAIDDASHLAVVDSNACGIPIFGPDITNEPHDSAFCSMRIIDQFDVPGGATLLYDPRFSSDNERLTLITLSGYGVYQRLVVGPNYLMDDHKEYIALGDSFSSGEGETSDEYYRSGSNTGDHKCHLSSRSYPYRLMTHGQNVACSGARILDIFGSGEYNGQSGRLLEVEAYKRNNTKREAIRSYTPGIVRQADFVQHYLPDKITIGVGGNDVGFVDKLKSCLGFSTCEWAKEGKGRRATFNEIRSLGDKLISLLRTLKPQSPKTNITLIGYPRFISEAESVRCPLIIDALLDQEERRFIDESIILLNNVIRSVARSEGVQYGDAEDALVGHRLCESGTSSVNGVRAGDDIAVTQHLPSLRLIGSESFHPTPYGHELIANALRSVINTEHPVAGRCSEYCDDDQISSYWDEHDTQGQYEYQLQHSFVQKEEYAPGEKIDFSLPSNVFDVSKTVSIELQFEDHSSINQILEQGANGISVKIPADASVGYYTLRVQGLTKINEHFTLYQVIGVDKEYTPVSVGTNLVKMPTSHISAPRPLSTQFSRMVESGAHYEDVLGSTVATSKRLMVEKVQPALQRKASSGINSSTNFVPWVVLLLALVFVGVIIVGIFVIAKSRTSRDEDI